MPKRIPSIELIPEVKDDELRHQLREVATAAEKADAVVGPVTWYCRTTKEDGYYALPKQDASFSTFVYWHALNGKEKTLPPRVIKMQLDELEASKAQAAPVQVGPPRFVEGIFWFVLPRKVREAVMGDAAEAYAETMKRCGGSRFWASVDYCKEAVFAIIGAVRISVGEWISLLFRRSS